MWTRRMAAGHGGGSTGSTLSASRWSDLPDDVLGRVRLRINSPRDRVRMTAVCKPWRDAASRLPAAPAVPALILSPGGRSSEKHLCGADGSWAMRVPSKAINKRFVGSYYGGWVAATDDRKLVIVNLFSGAEVVLSDKQSRIDSIPSSSTYSSENSIEKIIFSQDPSSSNGCTLAVLRTNPNCTSVISVCKVGCLPDGGWSSRLWRGDSIWDMAFYNGELYGLTDPTEILVRFEITMMEDGTSVITDTHRLPIQTRQYHWYNPMQYDAYIVELHAKLLMAVRSGWLPNRESFFKVFELVDANDEKGYKYKWSEVKSFGDYALFLGWSKAVHVPVDRCRGIKRNHIYYCMPFTEDELPNDKVYSLTYGDDIQICCREDQSIKDGVGRTIYYLMGCYNSPMWRDRCKSVSWIYPPDF